MKHKYTTIAPEVTPEGELHHAHTWEWCIRCGILRLGTLVFSPGPNQEKDLVADTSAVDCVVKADYINTREE